MKFLKVTGNRKEPEPQFIFSALGSNLISALLGSRLQLHNTSEKETKTIKAIFLYEKMLIGLLPKIHTRTLKRKTHECLLHDAQN
jgi:hypothetical protein